MGEIHQNSDNMTYLDENSDENCIFCKIVRGEIPSYKIYEDDRFIAILDIFPNTKGMTLVIPKAHFSSYAFDMNDDDYTAFMLAAKKVGKIIDEKLNVRRTSLVMEGMGVNHAHLKLYPMHGLFKKFEPIVPTDPLNNKVFFEKYEGYLTTLLGPKATEESLKELQLLFR
ncbi:hypothetical protein BH10BAC5_BH10BAC5_18940 [soil metagenome]